MGKFGTSRPWSRVWLATAAVVALAGSMVITMPAPAPASPGDLTGHTCNSAGNLAMGVRFGRRVISFFDGPSCVGKRVDCTGDPCVATVKAFATAAAGQASMKVTLQLDGCFNGCSWTNLESHTCVSSADILPPQCKVDFVRGNLTHMGGVVDVVGWRVLCEWNTSLVFTIRPKMSCGIQMSNQSGN